MTVPTEGTFGTAQAINVEDINLFLSIDGFPLGLLVPVDVVFLGELEVPQELRVHALHLELELGRGLAGWVPVMFPVLVVIGVILGLCHPESLRTHCKRNNRKQTH